MTKAVQTRSEVLLLCCLVAQVSNLLYRRLRAGWVSELLRIRNPRYSRLEVCATILTRALIGIDRTLKNPAHLSRFLFCTKRLAPTARSQSSSPRRGS